MNANILLIYPEFTLHSCLFFILQGTDRLFSNKAKAYSAVSKGRKNHQGRCVGRTQ